MVLLRGVLGCDGKEYLLSALQRRAVRIIGKHHIRSVFYILYIKMKVLTPIRLVTNAATLQFYATDLKKPQFLQSLGY